MLRLCCGACVCRKRPRRERGHRWILLEFALAPPRRCSWMCCRALPFVLCQNQDLYRAELRQSDTVVSCVGGFGKTDAYMGLVNGEANIKLAEVCLYLRVFLL